MEITDVELNKFKQWAADNRRVVALVNTPIGTVEFDGELRAVHATGLMIRPRGRMQPELAKMDDVERLELYDERPKPIEAKRMAHVIFGKIRDHLADRHGLALADLNDPKFTEAAAYDFHESEHAPTSPKMSHFHEG